jgi:hypothetical protein
MQAAEPEHPRLDVSIGAEKTAEFSASSRRIVGLAELLQLKIISNMPYVLALPYASALATTSPKSRRA